MAERPLTAAARERVVAAVRSGATIEAIRLYRQDTLASLADAKAAVESMAAAAGGRAPAAPAAADEAVALALFEGRKIEAIKRYRLAHRAELREAKDVVEAMEAELRATNPERFVASSPTGGGPIPRLVFVVDPACRGSGGRLALHAPPSQG